MYVGRSLKEHLEKGMEIPKFKEKTKFIRIFSRSLKPGEIVRLENHNDVYPSLESAIRGSKPTSDSLISKDIIFEIEKTEDQHEFKIVCLVGNASFLIRKIL